MKKAKPKRKPITYRATGRYGILNHFGDLWTPLTFLTEPEARAYIQGYEDRHKTSLRKHKPVPVRVTVTVVQDKRS